MKASALLHKRRALFLFILFVAFSTFAADVLDLREELHMLSCPGGSLDNNVTTAIISNIGSILESVVPLYPVHQKSSVHISFLHLLPYTLRAPPSRS
jgi:hypothetical protein